MARLPGAAAAELAKKLGTEPIIIAEITWGLGGPMRSYADRTYDGIPGKILEVSGLDSIIKLGSTGAAGGLSLKIDDTDNSIKLDVLDNFDVHKGQVNVYQAFGDLTESDKFLLLTGQINTPIEWDEAERTVSFDVVTFVEDKEIGFSPEQGEFDFIADSAVGVAWPLCFGSPIRVPAVKLTEKTRGVSLTRYGLITLSDLNNLCDRARTFSSAQRQKNVGDQNPGFSDANYAVVIDNYNSALSSLTILLEALIADSPTQESDLRAYADICISLEQEEANKAFFANEAVETQAAITANETAIESLQLQIVQLQAQVPVPVAEINALQDQLAVQQAELSTNNSQLLFFTAQLLATNSNIDIFTTTKTNLEKSLVKIVLAEILVDGGEDFPQGVELIIIVKGVKFKGTFSGRTFTVEEANLPFDLDVVINSRSLDNEFDVVDPTTDLKGKYCFFPGKGVVFVENQVLTKCVHTPILFEQTGALPPLLGIPDPEFTREIFNPINLDGSLAQTAVVLKQEWIDTFDPELSFATGLSLITEQDWSLEVGDVIYLDEDYQDVYVANLIPSVQVFEVFAFRTINEIRRLIPIPTRYYEVNLAEAIAGQTSTTLRFRRPLEDYVGENWDDTIYVSLESSVGPNTVDAIGYLVDTYTDFTKDAPSFAAVSAILAPAPSHFAILDRPGALPTIENIAWQARSVAFISNNAIKLRHLATDEPEEATITEDEIEVDTFKLAFSETEDLVTKFVAEWRLDYVAEEPNKLILRNNIPKYGEIEVFYDFFIYNVKSLVEQSAFFWMLRYSNTWKTVQFKAFLDNLVLENYDPVLLSLTPGLISNGDIKASVRKANYNSADFSLDFLVWTSVRSGEMDPYVFAFPASASIEEVYPTENDPFAGGAS